jgi:hypothetical protein
MRLATTFLICLAIGGFALSWDQPSLAWAQTTNAVPATGSAPSASTDKKPPTPAPSLKKKTTSSKKKVHHRKSSQSAAKVVVPNGSTAEPPVHFSTTVSLEKASQERDKTADLLATTNSNLEKISGQTLSPTQQETVKQVRGYISEAKNAEASGDLDSARNLALKAQLLSNDLIGK